MYLAVKYVTDDIVRCQFVVIKKIFNFLKFTLHIEMIQMEIAIFVNKEAQFAKIALISFTSDFNLLYIFVVQQMPLIMKN